MGFGITSYQVAIGHNNASGLSPMRPQPRNPSDIAYPEFLVGLDGSNIPQGNQSVDLLFQALSYAEWVATLAQFGLSKTVFNANVTVRLRQDDDTYANYNAIASHQTGKERGYGFWRAFVVTVGWLEAL